jgi:hypothetical protein
MNKINKENTKQPIILLDEYEKAILKSKKDKRNILTKMGNINGYEHIKEEFLKY